MRERVEKNKSPVPLLPELAAEEPDQEKKLDKMRHGVFGGRVQGSGASRPSLYLNADWSARKLDDEEAG
jgi:hypothetical protein